jgi:pantoate--beta-alanine ligase
VKKIQTVNKLRASIKAWREAGQTVALVPTMGNLHQGHLSLVALAAQHADRVVVSIFVNPTQFGAGEDFARYPRTLEADARKLSRADVDVLFAPTVDAMYPRGIEQATIVTVPGLSDDLCGKFRPGHFSGVTSVVSRLFNICMPDVAIFGQKDYQQVLVLQRMVEDLHFPVRLIKGSTERELDGLAMSSRNNFLDAEQRATATVIYRSLETLAAELRTGRRDYSALEAAAAATIRAAGMEPDYVAVRNADSLASPDSDSKRLVVLAAARLAGVRLIDNVLVKLPVLSGRVR